MKNPLTMQSSAVSRNAAALIATVAAGAAVYWLRDILTPLAMALFLLIMIDGVKRTVAARTPLNDRWAGVAALVLVVLAFFASIGIIVNGAAGFFGEASGVSQNIGPRIDQIIRDVYGMARLNNPPTAQELINGVDIRGYVASIAIQAQGIASGAFFVMVYLGFLLASQIGFRRNVTGAMICVVAWILMRAVGLQNAEFWTFVIFIVGFIPVLGGAVAGLAPPLFALVQFPSYWPALILLVGLQTILFIVGNMIQPRMQGDNQNIDPVVVLLSLAFWGKLWGVVGMFLSTPLAVMAMAILAEFQGSRWMAILLSGDGEPYADEGKSNRKKAGETETETEGRAGA
ncbi:MAG: AI-2E family transporter [Brevundimonas sp. 32-68-21]|nr:MAG: AI-2E family transporter [Brevundimonas sp. 32-68-21]